MRDNYQARYKKRGQRCGNADIKWVNYWHSHVHSYSTISVLLEKKSIEKYSNRGNKSHQIQEHNMWNDRGEYQNNWRPSIDSCNLLLITVKNAFTETKLWCNKWMGSDDEGHGTLCEYFCIGWACFPMAT